MIIYNNISCTTTNRPPEITCSLNDNIVGIFDLLREVCLLANQGKALDKISMGHGLADKICTTVAIIYICIQHEHRR